MVENKIHTLWPILIGEFHNKDHQKIKKDLIKFFKDYEKKNPIGSKNSRNGEIENYNLYESKYNLHEENNESLKKVLNFIGKSILTMSNYVNKKSIEQLTNKNQNFKVNLSETWFIRYNKGGVVFPHDHGNCSWCCVYYIQIGKDAKKKHGSTYFMRPYVSPDNSDFGGKYYSRVSAGIFEAEEGKMLVWPSFLYHGSHPYHGEQDRIILSANSSINLV